MTIERYPAESLSEITNTGISAVQGAGGMSVVHKFGRNAGLSTSYEPVATAGVYPMPTAAVSLEFISDDTADALDDTGMHELTVQGLDANYEEQTVVTAAHATDGLTAVAISGTWLRVYRAYVSKSGSYPGPSDGSHVGTITIRIASAGATYADIQASVFPYGQTEIACYTVPSGKTGYVSSVFVAVATTQAVDAVLMQRPSADDVSSSYNGTLRVVLNLNQLTDETNFKPVTPLGPFVGPCDLVWLAKGAVNNEISVDFEILLHDT